MKIAILGTGCAKCKQAAEVARQAVLEAGVDATIHKVEDLREIMRFKVMRTPAVAIDDKVVISGRVPTIAEVKSLLVRSWTLRAAVPRDLDAVREMLRKADLPAEGLEDRFPGGYAVAEAGGKVVGAAGVEVYGEHGLFRSLVVDPAWRGQGIGNALTLRLVERSGELRLRAVYLLTTTAEEYLAKLGFVRVERNTVPDGIRASGEFAGVCPASAVCMRRSMRT
jgi:amino-acid N-acetyltransferase